MDDTIKIPVELDADTKKLSAQIRGDIGEALATGLEEAIESTIPKALDVFKGLPKAFGGFNGPGDFASYLLTEGRYAPSNAVSIAMRTGYNLLSNAGYAGDSQDILMMRAGINAAAHNASDALRQARVAGRYDNFVDLYNTAVRTAENAKTPEERRAALSLAASYRQSLANQSYITAGLVSPEEAVSSRMAASAIRRSLSSKPEEDIIRQEQLAWETEQRRIKETDVSNLWFDMLAGKERNDQQILAWQEEERRAKEAEDVRNNQIRTQQTAWEAEQRRIKEIEMSNTWNSLLGEQERYEATNLAQKTAEDAKNEKIRAEQTAWDAEQRRIKEIEVSNEWNRLLDQRDKEEREKEKSVKNFKKLAESTADLTKAFVQGARVVTDVTVAEWGIASDMMDPLRTRRATRQQQAQKYGQMASGVGVGLLASGNPYAMLAGGALVVGGEVANFFGATNQARREAAEKYTGTLLDYNKRKLLYGNVNYASAQAAQLAGYTSAETVMNLDSTGSMLRGAMAFGAVGEQQMMALSMMPNYWRALMDPNASTTERLEAYAQDMNSLPEDYQAYINSILPGGDESLRAYTKSASYGMMKQGYETDRTIDAFYDKDVMSYEYANTRLGKKSRREHFKNIYERSPSMLRQQLSAGEDEMDPMLRLARNAEMSPFFQKMVGSLEKESNRPINVTVQLNGEVVAQNSYAQKNQEEAMTYL